MDLVVAGAGGVRRGPRAPDPRRDEADRRAGFTGVHEMGIEDETVAV